MRIFIHAVKVSPYSLLGEDVSADIFQDGDWVLGYGSWKDIEFETEILFSIGYAYVELHCTLSLMLITDDLNRTRMCVGGCENGYRLYNIM